MNKYLDMKWACYNQEPELKQCKKWFGIYKGVAFEINNFELGERDAWTHYIVLNIDKQLTKEWVDKFWLKGELRDNRIIYDYYIEPINSLEFHGGCTWYSKDAGFDGEPRVVKIGCDYQHYWDEGGTYDVDYVYSQVKKTIDSLYELVGDVKFWNMGDGVYRSISEYKGGTK